MYRGKSQSDSAVARHTKSNYRNNIKNSIVNNNNSSGSSTSNGKNNTFRTQGGNRYTKNNNSNNNTKNNHDKFNNRVGNDDGDDDDAPPVAMSARINNQRQEEQNSDHYSRNGNNNNSEMKSASHDKRNTSWHGKPQANKRLREHTESSASMPQVRNVHSGSVRVTDSSEEAKSPATKMITVLNEKETELPQKLNTKVFVDGLPYRYDPEPGQPSLEDELAQFVSAWKVGKVIRLIKKPGHGFGFLVFKSPNSVPVAIKVLHGRKFLGRPLRVALPKPRDLEAMNDVVGMKDMGKTSFRRQVLLSDLPKVCQPEIVREVLRDVAPQLESKLETIKMTSRNRKAFLTFTSEAEIPSAIQFLNGFHLLGRKIVAVPAAPPGSLPYSHTQPTTNTNITTTPNNAPQYSSSNTATSTNSVAHTNETVLHKEAVNQDHSHVSTPQGVHAVNVLKETTSSKHFGKAIPLNKKIDEEHENDNNEVAIVPLGAEVPAMRKSRQGNVLLPTTQATNKKVLQQQQHEQREGQRRGVLANRTMENTASNAKSNITGQTDKYNLLDNGPAEVYVGNLNENVTVNDLRAHFASCGKINHIELLAHPETHLPLGIARVTFAIPAYAAYAVSKLHGSRLHDSVIRVDRGDESSAPLSHERPSKLKLLLEHAAQVANTKTPIDINAIEKQNGGDSEDEEIDEVGFMAHHGIHNPEEYFRDTTVRFTSVDKENNRKGIAHAMKDQEEQGVKGKQQKKANLVNAKSSSKRMVGEKGSPEEMTTHEELKRQRSNLAKKHNRDIDDTDDNPHEHKKLKTLAVSSKGKKLKGDIDHTNNVDHEEVNDDDDGENYDKVALTGMLASDSDSEEEHFVDADSFTPELSHKEQSLPRTKSKKNKLVSKKEKHKSVKKDKSTLKRKQNSAGNVVKTKK